MSINGIGRAMQDYTGKKFFNLTALSFSHSKSRNHMYYWRFLCDCGREHVACISDVVRGRTKSCGCVKRKFTDAELGLRRVLYNYKKNAQQHGRMWSLSNTEFELLISGNCHYCGSPPNNNASRWTSEKRQINFAYNGIDRIDSNEGYIKGNVVSCCGTCNRMKLDHSYDYFIEHIEKVYKHLENIA